MIDPDWPIEDDPIYKDDIDRLMKEWKYTGERPDFDQPKLAAIDRLAEWKHPHTQQDNRNRLRKWAGLGDEQ